jgi:hypothetical protein
LVEGEVIGLIPEAACERESEWMRQLVGFDAQTKILEHRLGSSAGLAGGCISWFRWPQFRRANQPEGKIFGVGDGKSV